LNPDKSKRVKIFPTPMPDLRAEWQAQLSKRVEEMTKRKTKG